MQQTLQRAAVRVQPFVLPRGSAAGPSSYLRLPPKQSPQQKAAAAGKRPGRYGAPSPVEALAPAAAHAQGPVRGPSAPAALAEEVAPTVASASESASSAPDAAPRPGKRAGAVDTVSNLRVVKVVPPKQLYWQTQRSERNVLKKTLFREP